MMVDRFVLPVSGSPTPVRFPPITRDTLANGCSVWAMRHTAVPLVTVVLIVNRGSADDPADRPGLASLTGDMLDEGAGTREAIALAEAFARLGTELDIDVGPDVTVIGVTCLARFLTPVLDLIADVVARPRFAEPDFARVRDLRRNRLRQLSRSAGAVADRAFSGAVFGDHPYGHGGLGTTAALDAMTRDEARSLWSDGFVPDGSTLIVVGDVAPGDVMAAARQSLGSWIGSGRPSAVPAASTAVPAPEVRLVDRPGAPQSVLRVGHLGPPRRNDSYHVLVTLNAIVGGQFVSRINRNLREEKGITYGARSAFDFRRASGSFVCDTSVQADATAVAVGEILGELDRLRAEAVPGDELAIARASLTRGYVRHFETATQVARGCASLVTYGLDDATFDRFVPTVEAVTVSDLARAAKTFVRPADAAVVVVGDAARCHGALEALGRPVVITTTEF